MDDQLRKTYNVTLAKELHHESTIHQCARAQQGSVRASTRAAVSDARPFNRQCLTYLQSSWTPRLRCLREHPKTSTQYEALITGPSSHEQSITPSEDHISSSDNLVTPNHGAALSGQGLDQNENPAGDAFGSTPALEGRAAQFCTPGSTTCQRPIALGTHFQPSPIRIASKRPILSSSVTSDLSRQMTRDEYVAQAHERGAVGDLLSLGHEQTAETTVMDLADNLMDAEPIQAFDGDMGYPPFSGIYGRRWHIFTTFDLLGASQDITQSHLPQNSFETTESASQPQKGPVGKPAR